MSIFIRKTSIFDGKLSDLRELLSVRPLFRAKDIYGIFQATWQPVVWPVSESKFSLRKPLTGACEKGLDCGVAWPRRHPDQWATVPG